jgi:hypothetical protein
MRTHDGELKWHSIAGAAALAELRTTKQLKKSLYCVLRV